LSAKDTVKHGKPVTVEVVLSAPAKLTMTVSRGDKVIAQTTLTRTKAGHATLTWNGKSKRQFIARGAYSLVVSAVSKSGKSARTKATLHIT
jgi:hypothetical protein